MQVVRIARQVLALPLVNIGGIDIVNGQHKLLLAILWQLMRYNIRGLLQVGPSAGCTISPPGIGNSPFRGVSNILICIWQ